MTRPGNTIYRFADVEVNAIQACIRRDGTELHLRHKAFQVLLYLLEHRHRLVSKDELWENIWQGTAVTDDALTKCVTDIRKALGDDARQQRFLKTVSKSGYRFVGLVEEVSLLQAMSVVETEVTTFEVEIEDVAETALTSSSLSNQLQNASPAGLVGAGPSVRRRAMIPAIALGVLIIIGGVYAGYRFSRSSASSALDLTLGRATGKKTVAVMYLNNQSNTAELEWLREGLADMLINNLSRSKKLAVLKREQLHLILQRDGYKPGDEITLQNAMEIGRRSNAEVIVRGSFAQLEKSIRLDLQLYDVSSGELLAAEHLVEEQPSQILTQIDLLSLKLSAQLGAALAEADAQRGLAEAMTNNLDAYRYYSLALEHIQMYQFEDAIALLEKALALDPQFAMAHARIGYVRAVRMGDGEKATPHLEEALSLSDRLDEKHKLFVSAWLATAKHNTERTIELYRDVLKQYPLETEAYQRLSWILIKQNHCDESIQVTRQGLITDPDSEDLYNALGTACMRLGRNDEALAAYQRYTQLAPSDPNAWDSLALFHQCLGQYEDAESAYNRALALNPESGVAIIHLGHLRFHQGRYRAALDQYRRFIQIGRDDFARARGLTCEGWVYLQQRDLARAAAAAKQELRYNQTFVWNSFVLALARRDSVTVRRLSDWLFSPAFYELEKDLGRLRILEYQRGTLLQRQGRSEEALNHFRAALQQNAVEWNFDSFEDCLANAFLELGRFDEAVAEYERVLKLNSNYPLAHYHLAQAYERRGQPEQAENEYKEFLRIWSNADPDIPEIVLAKARLNAPKA